MLLNVLFLRMLSKTINAQSYCTEIKMDNINVNKFRDNLKNIVEKVISEHQPVKITRGSGEDFVIISAEDWAREQETLFVLQNTSLMQQILASTQTHAAKSGHTPSDEETRKILGVWRQYVKDRLIYKFDDQYVYIFAIGGYYKQL